MSNRPISALITCETTKSFLTELKNRNIRYELMGWGNTGIVLSQEELISKAKNCEIIVVEIEELNQKVLSSLPNLRFVGVSRGTPVNVDLEYCIKRDIRVIHTPGRNADSVADYCVAMMLNLTRELTISIEHLKSNGWMYEGKLPYLKFRGRELGKLKIGLYGYGQIGARVAKRLALGFNSQVFYYDPFVEKSDYAQKAGSLSELFEICDIISLHAPIIPETENSVDRNLLRKLGPSGFLISSARAKLILEEDLYQAVQLNEIAGAALDVYWQEPIDRTNRWLQMPNVICTPHIAGASLDVIANHCELILSGIDKWLSENQTKEELN